MTMDQDIAASGFATLELREDHDSREDQEREGQGPSVSPAAQLPQRERLPSRRYGYNQKARVGGQKIYLRTGDYPDGRLGEIFLASNKAGSQLDAAARDSAVTCSIALQFGAPVDNIRTALLREANGTPCSPLAAALDEIGKQKP